MVDFSLNKRGSVFLVIIAVLLVITIALWRQNTSLKNALENAPKLTVEDAINEDRTEEIKSLQGSLQQLLNLQKQLEGVEN